MEIKWMKRISFFLALVMLLTMLPVAALAETLEPASQPAETQSAEEYTVALTATDGGRVSGGGVYADGQEVTVTAHPAEDYEFTGWYDNGALVSPTPVYSFTALGPVSYQACFDSTVDSYALTVNGTENYTIRDERDEPLTASAIPANTSVTLTFTDETKTFLYWVNGNGNIVSTEPSYTFTMVRNTAVKAIYQHADENAPARVIFRNSFNQIVFDTASITDYTVEYNFTAALSSARPIRMGYTFDGWYLADADGKLTETEATNESIHDADGKLVVVLPKYVKTSGETYSVKVSYKTEDGADIEGHLPILEAEIPTGDKRNFTAKEIDGYKFLYWKIGSDIVGYDSVYSVIRAHAVTDAVELTAVYGAPDAEVEQSVIVNVIQTYGTISGGKYVISNTMQYYVPMDGAKVIETGFVYGTSSRFSNDQAETNLVLDGAKTYRSVNGSTAIRGLYTFNGRLTQPTTTLYIRAYVIYQSGDDIETVYSSVIQGTYYELTNTAPVTVEENTASTSANTTLVGQPQNNDVPVTATVPAGVVISTKATPETGPVTLTIIAKKSEDTTPKKVAEQVDQQTQESTNYKVEIEGVAQANTKPIVVHLRGVLPVGLVSSDVSAYHSGASMDYRNTANLTEKDTYYYDPATGDVYICVTNFSDFTFVHRKVTHTVTLDVNGENAVTTFPAVAVTDGKAMPALDGFALPTREGYTFLGYFDASDGGTQYYNADGTSAHNWENDAPTSLHAHWEKNAAISIVLPDKDFTYRIGNKNAVNVSKLFTVENGTIDNIEVVSANPQSVTAQFQNNQISFTGTGYVTISAKAGAVSSAPLTLEVVNATNVTSAASATTENKVLLDNITTSGFTVSNGYTLYGNGFEITVSGSSVAATRDYGFIELKSGTLDNVYVEGPNYPFAALYAENMQEHPVTTDKTRYAYVRSTVIARGDSTIRNSYISGGRAAVNASGARNLAIYDSTLYGGACANLLLEGTANALLSNLTTIQEPIAGTYINDDKNSSIAGNTETIMGMGILSMDASTVITLEGTLRQYNWICSSDVNNYVGNSNARQVLNAALSQDRYRFTRGNKTYINLGIAYLLSSSATINDDRTDQTELPYVSYTSSGVAYVYSTSNNNGALAVDDIPFWHQDTGDSCPAYTNYGYQILPVFTADASGAANAVTFGAGTPDGHTVTYREMVEYDKRIPTLTISMEMENGASATVDLTEFLSASVAGQPLTLSFTPEDTCTINGDVVSFPDKATGTFGITASAQYQGETYTWPVRIIIANSAIDAPVFIIDDSCGWTKDGTIYTTKGGECAKTTWGGYWNLGIPTLKYLKVQYYSPILEDYVLVDLNEYSTIPEEVEEGCKFSVSSTGLWKTGYTYSEKTKTYIYNDTLYQVCSDYNGYLGAGSTKSFDVKYTVSAGGKESSITVRWSNNGATYKSTDKFVDSFNSSGSSSKSTTVKPVFFDANGGELPVEYRRIDSVNNSDITLPTPTRTGYTFDGWYTAASGGTKVGDGGATYSPGANITDITLYAHWKAPFIVSFDTASSLPCEPIQNDSSTVITLPNLNRDDFWLEGWYDGETRVGGGNDSYIIPERNVTLEAHWRPKVIVIYDANGGDDPEGAVYQNEIALTLPEPTNGSKTFEGWYTEAEGGVKIGAEGDTFAPKEDNTQITLYAHWSDNIKVTFNGNGGTSDTNSDTYDHATPITLPTATWAGHRFNGWYTESSGGTKVGDAGASYEPTEPITLYAQWTAYTVSFDGNGATNPSALSAGSNGSVTLPTPNRTGYTFNGWYTETTGGTKSGNGGDTYAPTADITLHAHWTVNSYKVTIKTSNSSTAVTVSNTSVSNGGSVAYNSVVKVVLSYSESDSRTFTIKQGSTDVTRYSDEACTSSTTSTAAGTYYFKMPAGDVTLNSSSSSGFCVAAGTMVTMANGAQKAVEDLTEDDLVLSFDHEAGEYVEAPVYMVVKHGVADYDIILYSFSDGTELKIVGSHGLFDLDLLQYVDITETNYMDYLGDRFAKYENGQTIAVTLVSAQIIREKTDMIAPFSYGPLNVITNGMISYDTYLYGTYNYFEYDENMKYVESAMNSDIQSFGLYSFEDWENITNRDLYEAFNMKYLRIAEGKGLATREMFIGYIYWLYGMVEDGQVTSKYLRPGINVIYPIQPQ